MARGSSIDRDSIEYVKIPVTPPVGVVIDTQPVQVAILPDVARPIETDWQTAEWITGNIVRILMGSGALDVDAGTYKVWLRVTDNPEVPVLMAGTINVT